MNRERDTRLQREGYREVKRTTERKRQGGREQARELEGKKKPPPYCWGAGQENRAER